jgi:hypothetical protein
MSEVVREPALAQLPIFKELNFAENVTTLSEPLRENSCAQ